MNGNCALKLYHSFFKKTIELFHNMIYNNYYLLNLKLFISTTSLHYLQEGMAMLKKISFNGLSVIDVESQGFIGYVYSANQNLIDIMLQDGSHIFAYYGSIDNYGNFYTFCTNTSRCGKTCKGTPSPGVACIHNKVALSRAAFYVDI